MLLTEFQMQSISLKKKFRLNGTLSWHIGLRQQASAYIWTNQSNVQMFNAMYIYTSEEEQLVFGGGRLRRTLNGHRNERGAM